MLTASIPYANSILQHRCKFMTQFTSGSIRCFGVNSWRNSGHIQFTSCIITCLGVNNINSILAVHNFFFQIRELVMNKYFPYKENLQCNTIQALAQTGSLSCFSLWLLPGWTTGSWAGSVTGKSTFIASSCGVSKAATDSKNHAGTNSHLPHLWAQHGAHRELWAFMLCLSR